MYSSWDIEYHNLLNLILNEGYDHFDNSRKLNTKAIFGHQIKVNLEQGFPAITTKHLAFKSVVSELLWFLRGDTNLRYLHSVGNHIWDKDAYVYYCKYCKTTPLSEKDFIHKVTTDVKFAKRNGNLGPIYGSQWRNWRTNENTIINYKAFENGGGYAEYAEVSVDQLLKVIKGIKSNPNDRGHIISAYNIAELDQMALRPCHIMCQFNVRGNYLDCLFYMRSSDAFLGLPFNMASYALLTHIICLFTDKKPGVLTYSGGNIHIYENHFDAAKEQLNRDPETFKSPSINISGEAYTDIERFIEGGLTLDECLENLSVNDFKLANYTFFPSIKVDMVPKLKI